MAYIDKINKNSTDYDLQDSKAARSVDGTTASHVEEANQIYTTSGVAQTEYFIYRTTAGDASINTGPATLSKVIGHTVQTGHTDEVLTADGVFADPSTTVELNKATWRSKGLSSGTYSFLYDGSGWELNSETVDIATYGLTVTGNVAENDSIVVEYTPLVIGSLATTNPTSFVATGYNQYDATAGYAHVLGNNQYRIAGTYTSLGFTTTIGGTTTPVTVTDGKFTPAEDGYIYVTGASGNILIALVWSGSRDSDPFEAYETSTISIPTTDKNGNNLPNATYGIPSVHGVADELSLADRQYLQRIGHYTYSSANLATVEAMGVDYWYDTSDIFYVLPDLIVHELASTVVSDYTANDFGTEEFTGTTVSAGASLYYGNNLVDKLRNLADIQTIGTGLTLTDGELSSSGGGGGDSVYSTKTTSTSSTGGAVYIGNLGADQKPVQDPSPNDNHYKYFWALPYSNNGNTYGQPGNSSINIMGSAKGNSTVAIGAGAGANAYGAAYAVMIGPSANAGSSGVAIGDGAGTSQDYQGSVCIGASAIIETYGVKNAISLGRYAKATRTGELNIGTPDQTPAAGFNSTNYRVIGGVHDGQNLHDAATVAQGNTLSTSAPTTSTEGVLGQLWTDTTNMHTYQCTAISGSTYTWTQRW